MNARKSLKFRDYLRNELERRMTINSAYSLRAFARDLKMPASRLSEFLSGKSKVSLNRVYDITKHLKLSDSEAQFVNDIATIEYGRTEEVKKLALKRVSLLRASDVQLTTLDFEEISDWYYFALLETLSKIQHKMTVPELAISIGIKENLCQFAVDRLLRKGLLSVEDGYLKATHKSLHVVGEPTKSIQKFHRQFIAESVTAFEKSEYDEREFSSSFVMLTDQEIQHLRSKIKNTVESVFLQINEKRKFEIESKENKQKLKLYGLGVQLFPIKAKKVIFSEKEKL